MRVLEVLIYMVIVLIMLAYMINKYRPKEVASYYAYLPTCLLVLHVIIDGYRWQMALAYLVSILMLISQLFKQFKKKNTRKEASRLWYISRFILLLLFGLSISLPIFLPVVDLPAPSGDYKVGTSRLYLKDNQRPEELTEDDGDVRELMLNLWYPTDQEDGLIKSYWTKEDIKNRVYADFLLPGNFWYAYLALCESNSQLEAELSSQRDKYPVVIYSHSYKSQDNEYTTLCEELASHGYIVMAVSHTYEASATIFPEGRIVKGDVSYLETIHKYDADKEYQDYENLLEVIERAESDADKVTAAKAFISQQTVDLNLLEIRVKDIRTIIDQLALINNQLGILQGGIDLEKIGVVGWSFGGATGIQASVEDDRIDVVVNMDGAPYGDHYLNNLTKETPTMIINDLHDNEQASITNKIIWDELGETYRADYKLVEVPDIVHTNFNDYPLLFGVMKYFGYWGQLSPDDLMEVHRQETIPFLDKYLE